MSTGAYASLNLGSRGDDEARIVENRRIVCAELGLDAERLAVNRQRHTASVHRARAGVARDGRCALDATSPGSRCSRSPPTASRSRSRRRAGAPALAVVHAGWRGLAAGWSRAASPRSATRQTAAIVGPSIGPCCYEVGPEVSARFDDDLTDGRMLDLWTAAERALRRAGVDSVERLDRCTRCHSDEFFSHRASGVPHGTQGVIGALAG